MAEKKINFEQAFKRLTEISNEMENDEIELEKAMKLYEEGEKLNKFCQEFINDCKIKIEKLKENQ